MPDLILSLVRGEPFLTEDISVVKPDGPHKAIAQLLRRSKNLPEVIDAKTQREASLVASEIQALLKGLETQYRALKAPYVAGGRSLDQQYNDIAGPMRAAYQHAANLVAAFQTQERRKQELARARAEAEARAKEEAERARLTEIEKAKQEAEIKARLAEDPAERLDNQRTAQQLANAAEEQRVALELQREELPMAPVPEAPKLVGGRFYYEYDIQITDIYAFAKAHPELVEITLKKGATKEAIRLLDEAGKPLQMPGLRIYKQPKAAFVGAATVRITKE
jgi:hypothetical protein